MYNDLRLAADWVFKRIGSRGELHPWALAISLDLHFVPVDTPGSRLVGSRIEYEHKAPAAKKRWQVMRECARAILRRRGSSDDDSSSDVLAMLFSVPTAASSSLSLVLARDASSASHRMSVVKAGTLRRRCSTRQPARIAP